MRNIFHSDLKQLYDCDDCYQLYDFDSILSYTQLTRINTFSLYDLVDVNQLLTFSNIKWLKIHGRINNISNLCKLQYLKDIIIQDYVKSNNSIRIDHPTVTRIRIFDANHCVIENCYNLRYLKLINCETFIVNSSLLKFQTIILKIFNSKENNFDIDHCINLKCLKLENVQIPIYLSSNLANLNSLHIHDSNNINIDRIVANNLTSMLLYRACGVFDFLNYTNLKYLYLLATTQINIDSLVRLEYLDLFYPLTKNIFVDCNNHTNLTHLRIERCKFFNLRRLTKLQLHTLILEDFNIDEMKDAWNYELKYLSRLTCLNLFVDRGSNELILDSKHLSNCILLKSLRFNFKLNDWTFISTSHKPVHSTEPGKAREESRNILHILSKLQSLDIEDCLNCDIISSLTKLTKLNIGKCVKDHILICEKLNRINNLHVSSENIIYPKMKVIE